MRKSAGWLRLVERESEESGEYEGVWTGRCEQVSIAAPLVANWSTKRPNIYPAHSVKS